MSRLFRTLSSLGSSRRDRAIVTSGLSAHELADRSDQDRYQNQELEIAEIENKLQNWTLPDISFKEIYKSSMFENFKTHSITQTIESSKSITQQHESINLLNEELLDKHKQQGFNYIHLGLIQVAVKPLHKLGLNTPILLVLRDSRIKTFPESIIAILESNLNDGPVYFNCYPNYSMNLRDSFTPTSLVINIQCLIVNSFK